MKPERIVDPLKRRRVNSGLSQKDMADRLGVTQSHYSRIESAKTEPTKYLDELGKIFGCLPEEVFVHAILKEIEDEYLNDTSKTQRMGQPPHWPCCRHCWTRPSRNSDQFKLDLFCATATKRP